MPNNRKIIERLVHDSETEMNRHELEQLLEAEISKPAEQMNVQLVQELLAVLQPGEVPQAQKQQVWEKIAHAFRSQEKKKRFPLYRLPIIAAIIILLFGLTIGAASALRWTFLYKLLQPIAETFGIYMNYPDDLPSDSASENLYGISEDKNTTVVYSDLSMIPDEYDGYAIKPEWVPEGFTFVQATSFEEINLVKYTIDYQRENDELNIYVYIYSDSDGMSSYYFERTEEIVSEKLIDSKMVTFYSNAKDQVQTVSWVDGTLHYSIIGNVTQDEIEKIIASFWGDQSK